MSLTPLTEYTDYIDVALTCNGRNAQWLNLLTENTMSVKGGAGTVVAPIGSAFTAQTPSDGTLQQNGMNNTLTALTAYDKICTISLKPSQAEALDFDGPNLEKHGNRMAAAIQAAIATQIIADNVAATPGYSQALATGKIDFAGAGLAEFQILDGAIGYVLANTDGDPSNLFILAATTAYGNLFSARNFGGAGFNGLGLTPAGFLSYAGIEMYPVAATSTNWGAASKACIYVMHKDAYGLVWKGARLHGGAIWQEVADGTFKHQVTGCWHGAVTVAGVMGEVTNPAS